MWTGIRFVIPKGLRERSQAIYCLEFMRKREPSRKDGLIGGHDALHRPPSANPGPGSYRTGRELVGLCPEGTLGLSPGF
jgi:hypothetical protein